MRRRAPRRPARRNRHAGRLHRARQTFVTCPNQDVAYGLGFFALDEEPVVIQVPDFGDRFWVYAMYDAAPTSSRSSASRTTRGRVLSARRVLPGRAMTRLAFSGRARPTELANADPAHPPR